MAKVLFIPFSILAGLLGAFIAKKAFEAVWGMIDDAEPPEPEHRTAPWPKLIAALAIEGAIFRAVRGAAERASRRGFYGMTGVWPGEERPEPQ